MSKKWTGWIPHTGDECPMNGDEIVRVKNDKGCTGKGLAKHWMWSPQVSGLTHYKRLKKNVEAEGAWLDETDETGITLSAEISMVYRNYRGETSHRTIRPVSLSLTSTEYHADMQWILRAWDVDKGAERDFALRDCNFKASADVEEAIRVKNNAEISAGMPKIYVDFDWNRKPLFGEPAISPVHTPEQPEAIITGPGEYKTADGLMAVVKSTLKGPGYIWAGFIVGETTETKWFDSGSSFAGNTGHDIVGPWTAPDEQREIIIDHLGEYKTADGQKATIHKLGCNTPWPAVGSVGGVRLNWNQWGDGIWQCFDITGPWVEDEPDISEEFRHIKADLDSLKDRPETRRGPYVIKDSDLGEPKPEKAEVWANLYRNSDGGLYLGVCREGTLKGAMKSTSLFAQTYIGPVLLSHTVEEGE